MSKPKKAGKPAKKPVKRYASPMATTDHELAQRITSGLKTKSLNPFESLLAIKVLGAIGDLRPGPKVTRAVAEAIIDVAEHFDHWGRRTNVDGTVAYADPTAAIKATL